MKTIFDKTIFDKRKCLKKSLIGSREFLFFKLKNVPLEWAQKIYKEEEFSRIEDFTHGCDGCRENSDKNLTTAFSYACDRCKVCTYICSPCYEKGKCLTEGVGMFFLMGHKGRFNLFCKGCYGEILDQLILDDGIKFIFGLEEEYELQPHHEDPMISSIRCFLCKIYYHFCVNCRRYRKYMCDACYEYNKYDPSKEKK
jgi:hypothetical protein